MTLHDITFKTKTKTNDNPEFSSIRFPDPGLSRVPNAYSCQSTLFVTFSISRSSRARRQGEWPAFLARAPPLPKLETASNRLIDRTHALQRSLHHSLNTLCLAFPPSVHPSILHSTPPHPIAPSSSPWLIDRGRRDEESPFPPPLVDQGCEQLEKKHTYDPEQA